jgi:hypothetical protein
MPLDTTPPLHVLQRPQTPRGGTTSDMIRVESIRTRKGGSEGAGERGRGGEGKRRTSQTTPRSLSRM